MLNFLHGGSAGDIVYSLVCIRALLEENVEEGRLFLQPGLPPDLYTGGTHPAGKYRMNNKIAEAMLPLLSSQSYIKRVAIWNKERIDVDLNLFRFTGQDLGRGHIGRWYGYAFDVQLDFTKPWLNVEKVLDYGLVVSRTSRYRNKSINYGFLAQYKPVFLGLKDEWKEFNKQCPCEFVETNDFLEVAKIIAGAKAFIGNQSCAFAIAEALKVPRGLEVCTWAQNVVPEGPNAYDFIGQRAFQKIGERLMENAKSRPEDGSSHESKV